MQFNQTTNLNCTLNEDSFRMWNCSFYGDDACRQQAENDIGGLGVLIAFIVTSYLTLILAWASFLFRPGKGLLENEASVLDRHFLAWIWKWVKSAPELPSAWASVLRKSILHLSDSQIVTGISILTAAFIQSGRLSVYHFHVVVYLAWLASSTHMTTLTVLRTFLRRQRQVLKWRVIAMTIMFIMLLAAIVLTTSRIWPQNGWDPFVLGELFLDSPVRCAWEHKYMRSWEPDTIISVCLLTAGYLARLSKLFVSTSGFFRYWLRERPGAYLKGMHDNADRRARTSSNPVARLYWKLLATFLLGCYVDGRSLYDLYESLLSELIWLSFSLLWGTFKIFIWRGGAPIREYEDAWTFGQLLPLLLLLIPLAAIAELYEESQKTDGDDNSQLVLGQADPHTMYTKARRSPAPQINVDVGMVDLLVPGEMGFRARSRSADQISSAASSNSHLHSISGGPLLHPLPYGRSSTPQPDEVTRPLLLTVPEFLYKFKAFKFLVFCNVCMVALPFIIILIFMAQGYSQAGYLLLGEPYIAAMIDLPIILGPRFIWFALMMPWSRATRPQYFSALDAGNSE